MEIRRVRTIDEYKRVENLQREIWGMEGESPVPVTIMVAINNNGGLIEIAIENDEIIGFSLAFPARSGEYEYLYSHMAGVLNEYRNSNIGFMLKMHQFELAKQMGYREIRWTFDPLKVRNSYFNTHKLKAFAYDYRINYYGFMESKENKGIESDRIEAHKFIDKEPVSINNFTVVSKVSKEGLFHREAEKIEDDFIGLEVPEEIPRDNIELLRDWRMRTREIFITLDRKEYVMVDVKRESPRAYLIFSKRDKSGI